MRRALWPDCDETELDGLFLREGQAVLIAEHGEQAIGFAEVAVRSYAEGASGPAAYLEGIWVDPAFRRRGAAMALLEAAEAWGKARGHSHLGSDADIDNAESHAWHRAAGFAEIERLVLFGKTIA